MLKLVVEPALPALEGLEQEEFVEDESEVEAIVGQLELGMVGFVGDVVALGLLSAVELVEAVVTVGIVEETLDYSVEQVSGAEVVD